MYVRVAGRMNAATAATANHVAAQLWNPHATSRIHVMEIMVTVTTANVANVGLKRSTARGGTPAVTATPTIANTDGRDLLDPSGTVLELAAFGTQPTLEGADMWRWNLPAAIGAGAMFVPTHQLTVPAGTGLCLYTPVATAFALSDVSFAYEL